MKLLERFSAWRESRRQRSIEKAANRETLGAPSEKGTPQGHGASANKGMMGPN